jgi:1,2-diacylglycerol 3-beta-glucosyltransferase
MSIGAFLLWLFGCYLALTVLYKGLITLTSWVVAQRSSEHDGRVALRIAVLMPAHNEEAGVAGAVASVLESNYSEDYFELYVVADNCADATAERARGAGATVIERYDLSKRGKGPALAWALQSLAEPLAEFDLICFVDADMQLDPMFFRNAVAAFQREDVEIVQGRYLMSSENLNWLRAVAFASFAVVNHLQPAGRAVLGGTAGLKGGGMVFRRELIMRLGWPAHSIVEDLEFGLDLLLRGHKVHYVPDARVSSTVPRVLADVAVQQSRWEGGKFAVIRKYAPKLLAHAVRRRSLAAIDALLDLCMPPMTVWIALSVVGAIAAWIWLPAAVPVFLASLAVAGLMIVSALVQVKAPLRVWRGLALAPLFLVWKLLLLARLAFGRRSNAWRRTPRTPD